MVSFFKDFKTCEEIKSKVLKNNLANAKSEDSRIFTLIQLGTLYCNSPYPRDSNLKAALYMGRQARQISLRFNSVKGYNDAQLLIAFIFLRREQIDSAIQISKLVNDTTRFTLLLAISKVYRARVNSDKVSDRYKAMEFALAAKRLSDSLPLPEKKILALQGIAMLHAETQSPNAENELLDVIKQFQAIKYPFLHYAYYALTDLSAAQGNYDKSLYYCNQTFKRYDDDRR
jgi:hypothetical protein